MERGGGGRHDLPRLLGPLRRFLGEVYDIISHSLSSRAMLIDAVWAHSALAGLVIELFTADLALDGRHDVGQKFGAKLRFDVVGAIDPDLTS